jgi:hypothetical protein
MATSPAEQAVRRRAGWTLAGITLAVIAVVATLVAVIAAHHVTTPSTRRSGGSPSQPTVPSVEHWNIAAEDALATRPMLMLPPQDAQPHPLTSRTAGAPISLPRAATTADRWIPNGFPATAEGALAQLKALDEKAADGGDPDTYARAYRQFSLPGAPEAGSTGLSSVLVSFRAAGDLAATGSVGNLSVVYQIVEGLIKGTADDGRYVVVCGLGELTVRYQAQTISVGVGDCQALRWTGTNWRISPGRLAAPATCAWPGSVESVDAGYRELS